MGWFFRVFDTFDECKRTRGGGVGYVCVVETVCVSMIVWVNES